MELFMELNASDDQFDFKMIYASAKQGWAKTSLAGESNDMAPLLDAILMEIPAPREKPTTGFNCSFATSTTTNT